MKFKIIFTAVFFLLCISAFAAENDCVFLAKVVATELPNEPFVVKEAFCEMLLNRVKNKNFPDTLKAICFSLGLKHDKKPTENDIKAAVIADMGFGFCKEAVHYEKIDRVKRTPPEKQGGVRLYDWYFYR